MRDMEMDAVYGRYCKFVREMFEGTGISTDSRIVPRTQFLEYVAELPPEALENRLKAWNTGYHEWVTKRGEAHGRDADRWREFGFPDGTAQRFQQLLTEEN